MPAEPARRQKVDDELRLAHVERFQHIGEALFVAGQLSGLTVCQKQKPFLPALNQLDHVEHCLRAARRGVGARAAGRARWAGELRGGRRGWRVHSRTHLGLDHVQLLKRVLVLVLSIHHCAIAWVFDDNQCRWWFLWLYDQIRPRI